MDEADWRRLEHPELDRLTSVIFSAVWAGAASLRAEPHKKYGLRPRDRVDPAHAAEPIFRYFDKLARLFDQPLPELYAQPDLPGQVLLANCMEGRTLVPALVVRKRCFDTKLPSALAFLAGRWLAALRPEWYLALALPDEDLDVAFWAAVGLVRPDAAIPKKFRAASYAASVKLRDFVPTSHLAPLAEVVARVYARGYAPDLKAWRGAVVETCDRAGLLACGDLDGAEEVVAPLAPTVGDDVVETRLRQLELFSVSLDYFELREQLGLDPPSQS